MDDSKKRRVRGSNFSNDEKILLLRLVDKYKNILECKRTDASACREKKATWNKVAREFNANIYSSEKRTAENVKTCYENLKRCTKKIALTNNRRLVAKPPCNSCSGKYDPIFELTLSILNKTEELSKCGGKTWLMEDTDRTSSDNHEEYTETTKNFSAREIKTETDYYPVEEQAKIVDDDINDAEESCSQKSEMMSENVNGGYKELVSLKAEMYQQQLLMLKREEEYKEKQRRRDEMEFEIEKQRREKKWELEQKSLLLDIKVKEAQLKNINLNLNLM